MTQNRKGFTLIEVVMVAAIIGTLAAIAVPRFVGSKDKAYVAAMKADLHTIALYEEQYAADNHGQTLTAFNILSSQLADWTATVTHAQTSQSCEMRAGAITCTTGNVLTTGIFPPS